MATSATLLQTKLTKLRWPSTIIARFVAKRTMRSATFVALALGVFGASKIIGYADVYPTMKERLVSAAQFANNTGLKALFGTPYHLELVTGYAAWYTIALSVLLGGIWAYLVATKAFRGEESAGRWELLLVGQTTGEGAAANALVGLATSLLLFFAIVAVCFIIIGKQHSVNFAPSAALYLALAASMGAMLFIAVGALASQLMPTRAKAAGLSTAVFGVWYLMRSAGDVTSARWILDITPLGWVEKLHPMFSTQPIWFLPIFALTGVLVVLTIQIAGRRDLGDSVIAEKDIAKPHYRLLNGPFGATVRLTRAITASWVAAMLLFMAYFGALTGTATKLLSASPSAENLISKLSRGGQTASAKIFLGAGFMVFILILMSYAAYVVGSIREDEAQGYLDNYLVQPISRLRWLFGRLGLAIMVIAFTALGAGLFSWLGLGSNHYGLTVSTLVTAGFNAVPAAILTLGIGVLAVGFLPRLTTVISYGVIAWALLIELLGSGLHLNHWLLDTSVLTHVVLAPAASPNWATGAHLVIIGAILGAIGIMRFRRRDIQPE